MFSVNFKSFLNLPYLKFFLFFVPLRQGLQTMARGPDAAREAISSGPRSHFVNDENTMYTTCLRKIC